MRQERVRSWNAHGVIAVKSRLALFAKSCHASKLDSVAQIFVSVQRNLDRSLGYVRASAQTEMSVPRFADHREHDTIE
jgi:hypothetical protein